VTQIRGGVSMMPLDEESTSTWQAYAPGPCGSVTGTHPSTESVTPDLAPHAACGTSLVPGGGGNAPAGIVKCMRSRPSPSRNAPWCDPISVGGLHSAGPSLSRHDGAIIGCA